MKTLLLTILLITSAQAETYSNLGEFVNSEMESQSDSFVGYEALLDSDLSNEAFYLNVIRVRVRGTIGLEIPVFASFELKPFLELRWKRKSPEGMTSYKL